MTSQRVFYDMLFIVPYYGAKEGFIWKAIEYRFQSPGVLSIASYLNHKGYHCAVFDCNLEQISDADFEKEFEKKFGNTRFKYFGFSAATQTVNSAFKLADILKKKYPDVPAIFGGPHPSALPEDVLKHDFADIVVVGEGEFTTEKILQNTELSLIKGIVYKKDKKIITNSRCDRIENLDDLPIIDYSLVPVNLCKPLIGTFHKLPATIMVTARGCPGRCIFCSRVVGNELYVNSPQRIMEEIKILYYKFGFRQIIFYDDTFISIPKRIEEFCDLMIASGLKISWTCSSRVDRVYPDLLLKMKKAGCHQIMYGIESFDEKILHNIHKKTQPEDIFYAVKETQKAGIEARAAIMIGNPGDTEEILKENIRKLKKINPDMIQVTITTAIPGSQLFTDSLKSNKILTLNWNDYEGNVQITKHETLDFKTMQKYYRMTYVKFYIRAGFIIRTLLRTNSWIKMKVIIIGAVSIIPVIFSSAFKRKKNEK